MVEKRFAAFGGVCTSFLFPSCKIPAAPIRGRLILRFNLSVTYTFWQTRGTLIERIEEACGRESHQQDHIYKLAATGPCSKQFCCLCYDQSANRGTCRGDKWDVAASRLAVHSVEQDRKCSSFAFNNVLCWIQTQKSRAPAVAGSSTKKIAHAGPM